MSLSVTLFGVRDLVGDQEAKEEGSHNVVVCVIGRVLFRQVKGFGNQRRIRHCNTSKDSRRKRIGCHVAPKR